MLLPEQATLVVSVAPSVLVSVGLVLVRSGNSVESEPSMADCEEVAVWCAPAPTAIEMGVVVPVRSLPAVEAGVPEVAWLETVSEAGTSFASGPPGIWY